MNQLLPLQLSSLFKYAEWTAVVKQNDHAFVNVLDIARFGTVDVLFEKLLKARFKNQFNKKYPYDAFQRYAGNPPKVLRN